MPKIALETARWWDKSLLGEIRGLFGSSLILGIVIPWLADVEVVNPQKKYSNVFS